MTVYRDDIIHDMLCTHHEFARKIYEIYDDDDDIIQDMICTHHECHSAPTKLKLSSFHCLSRVEP